MKRIYKSLLCLILCVSTVIAALPFKAYAAANEYISDIKMVSINDDDPEDRERAQKELTDAGYKITYSNWGNLNAGADDGCCYIGYKTTTDRSKAITDLRVMDMNGGYIKTSYDGLNPATRQGIDRMKAGMNDAAKELNENYGKGSPAAKYAIEDLNRLTIDSLDNMPMGNAIVLNKLTDDVLEDILTHASGRTLSLIFNYLMVGCADYSSDGKTWIDRVNEIPFNKKFPAEMYTEAEYFVDSIEDTGKKVEESLKFYDSLYEIEYNKKYEEQYQKELEYETSLLTDKEKADPKKMEEAKAFASATAKEIVVGFDDELNEAAHNALLAMASADPKNASDEQAKQKQLAAAKALYYVSINDIFNRYEVLVPSYKLDKNGNVETDENGNFVADGVPCGLGDSLWGWTETDRFQVEWCYPVFEALTPGQRAVIPFSGIENFISITLDNSEEALKKHSEETARRAKAQGFTDEQLNGSLSVFWDYNEELANGTAFLTDKAARSIASQGDIAALTAFENGPKRELFDAMQWSAISSGILAVFDIGLSIYSFVTGATVGFSALCTAVTTGASVSFALAFGGVLGLLNGLGILISLCITLAYFIIQIIYHFRKVVYSDMPNTLYDAKVVEGERMDRLVRYDLVKSPDGENADLNAFRSDKWLALYYSKDSTAGNPILADFVRKEGNGNTPNGWSPLRKFGGRYAVNTNLHADEDRRNGLYLFFHRDGGEEAWVEDGRYLRSVKVVHGDNESMLKSEIQASEECEFFASNLTPSNGFTFLSYSTTDDPNDAIKDIRVLYGINIDNSKGGFYIGDAPYANSGYAGGFSFLTSKKSVTGDPIFADSFLAIGDNPMHPDYIPVCLAAGGPAVNLNEDRGYGSEEKDELVYLYFQSDRAPEDTNDTLYVSGIAEVMIGDRLSGYDISEGDVVAYAEKLGYTAFPKTAKREFEGNFKIDTKVMSCYGYSTTTYYKRALQDIVVDDSKAKQTAQISTRNSAYMCIPSPMLYKYDGSAWSKKHAYIADYPFSAGTYQQTMNKTVQYVDSPMLYVKPATSKETAITASDFMIIDKIVYPKSSLSTRLGALYHYYNADKMFVYDDSVVTYAAKVLDKDAAGAINDKFYVLFKGAQGTIGKYVSGICTSEIREDNGDMNRAYLTMIGQGADALVGNYTMPDYKESVNTTKYHHFSLGLMRTDDERRALTDIKIVCYPQEAKPQEELLFSNEIRYTLASKSGICFLDENNPDKTAYDLAYIYVTNNPNAGSKITKFYFSENALMNGSEYLEFEKYTGIFGMKNGEYIDQLSLLWKQVVGVLDSDTKIYNTTDSNYIENLNNHPNYYYYVEREAPNKYISDVGIVKYVTGNVAPSDYKNIVRDKVTKYYTNAINQDLNEGAGFGSLYINVVYKRTFDPQNAITDLRAVTVSKAADAKQYITDDNGIVYRKVHNGECPDLNELGGGDYIYMYSTKDPRAGKPITDIIVRISDTMNTHNTSNYKWIKYPNSSSSVNFNKNSGGSYVWIEFLRDNDYNTNPGFASFFSELSPYSYIVVGASILTAAGFFIYGVIRKKNSRRKKEEETV